MTRLIDAAAIAAAAAGVVVIMIAAMIRHPRSGVRAALDLWLASGILRISSTTSWPTLAVTAAVVVVRKLVSARPASRKTSSGQVGDLR